MFTYPLYDACQCLFSIRRTRDHGFYIIRDWGVLPLANILAYVWNTFLHTTRDMISTVCNENNNNNNNKNCLPPDWVIEKERENEMKKKMVEEIRCANLPCISQWTWSPVRSFPGPVQWCHPICFVCCKSPDNPSSRFSLRSSPCSCDF